MKKELLRLFKGYLSEETSITTVNKKALKFGILISDSAPVDVVEEAIAQYGKDGELFNATFHKSWDKVANASLEQLLIEQVIHYITVYGFESLGCFDSSTVYIPAEKLEVPDVDVNKIKLTAIVPLTLSAVETRLMNLLTSGIALSEQTVQDVKTLSDFIDKERFDEIANKEVRTFLYDKYNIVPKNPEVFLRFLIYKLTGSTLKITNDAMCYNLKESDTEMALALLKSYHNYSKLSSIFLRNKRIFLALKRKNNAEINKIINKIRKLAVTNHKPLTVGLLDKLTYSKFTKKELVEELDKVTLFRAVRILNMLSFRISGCKNIVYRVRNGKSFVSTIDTESHKADLKRAYKIVKEYIADKMSAKVANKYVYIPANNVYMAPSSEKQFVGNIPEGSTFEIPNNEDLIVGVHWFNLPNRRIDLDLHMEDDQGHNYGWCYGVRDSKRKVLFSGDRTDAPRPHGASELYYITASKDDFCGNLTLNQFNTATSVPFELIIAKSRGKAGNYTINPNLVIAKFDLKTENKQIKIGTIKVENGVASFSLNSFALGIQSSVTYRNAYTEGALEYAKVCSKTQATLKELLEAAGAKIVNSKVIEVNENEHIEADIDLSLENISKDTIIDLFTK